MHAVYIDQFLSSHGKSPYEKWHGHAPSDNMLNSIRTWGSIVYFTHHEDRHKLQMPGHRGQFLGYCPQTDGCFIRDLDNTNKPVRITRDVLARSYNETQHLVREPVGVDFSSYQLLENESPLDNRIDSCVDLPWEALLFKDCDAVAQDTLNYWRLASAAIVSYSY